MKVMVLNDVHATVSVAVDAEGLDVLLSVAEYEDANPQIVGLSRFQARELATELNRLADLIDTSLCEKGE